MNTVLNIYLLGLLSASQSLFGATIADQSQLLVTGTADNLSNGRSGQTFVAGYDGLLVGIKLFIKPQGFSDSPVLGSDFILALRSVAGGTPTGTTLTTGSFSRSRFISESIQEFDILFDIPYQQSAGELLAFTFLGTSGGGINGYNEFGFSNGNTYLEGQRFYTFTEGSSLTSSTLDFAFQTLVSVPEPTALISGLLTFGGLLLIRRKINCA